MTVQMIRELYNYHFSENRNLWDAYLNALSGEQFTRNIDGHWSVREHIVHIISVDDTWFSGLRGLDIPEPLDPEAFPDRQSILAYQDTVEQTMREYLFLLRDEQLEDKPLEGEDADLKVWQVLLHVVNHGTDHRAQLLRVLNDLGIKTTAQDYIFYVYEHV